jgi:hypothetical protein
MLSRRLLFLVAAGCLLFTTGAAAAEGDAFIAAATPSHVKPSSSAPYTITLTNAPASPSRGQRARIAIPAGFTVDGTSIQATTQAVGGCDGSAWEVEGAVTSEINLRRPGNNDTGLCPGAALAVSFTTTSAADETTYTWTTQLFVGETEESTLTGSQPTVVVDGTPPETTIDSHPPEATNSTSASFTYGSSEPGTFECSLDGGEFAPCTSPTEYTGLGQGNHDFAVRAVDAAGNDDATPASDSWMIDLTPPQTAIDGGPQSPTNQTSASFSFSSEPGTTFQCSLDDADFVACMSPQTYSGLLEGTHTFRVRATDAVGNIDPSPAEHTLTVDTTPPTVAITDQPNALTNSQSASFGFIASDPTQCKLDTGSFVSCNSPRNYIDLDDGLHTFTVTASDAAGNSAQADYTWTIDATPPTVAIGDKPNALTNSRSATFSFTASEATQCRLDNAEFTACTSTTSYADLADGSHTFVVQATDLAGNAAQATHTWTVDATPPTVAITGGKPGSLTNVRSVSFLFTAGEAAQCKLDSGEFEACTSPFADSNLDDGPHMFTVRATDPAGNTGQDSHSWTIDTAAPTLTLQTTPNNPSNSPSASFTFVTSEGTQCGLDGGPFTSCASPAVVGNLGDGLHTFTVRAIDAAQNTSEVNYSWTVDMVAPTVEITQKPDNPSNVKSPTFGFSVSESAAFLCSLDFGQFQPCSNPQGYTLNDGFHTFTVKARDAAGNVGPQAEPYRWLLETVLPIVTLTERPSDQSNSTSARFTFVPSKPSTTLECKLDAGAYVGCSSPKIYTGLGQGPHTFAVRARDAAQNVGPESVDSWSVDSLGPAAEIAERPGSPTNSQSARFAFSASEPSSFVCQLDGSGFGPCASPLSYHGLGDGAHTFTVRPTDALGNVGATASYTWQVDATAPETTLAARPASRTTATAATFTFSANEPSGFECKLDTAAFAPCSSPKTHTGLTQAAHSFEVRAVDATGNVDPTPAIHRWTVITPVVTRTRKAVSALLAPRAGARVTSPPLLRWRRAPRASYYNVQLFRGSVKVLSSWPTATRLQLRARWTYLGRKRRLTAGTYRWYVWPGYGKASLRRYGRLLGGSTFKVVSRVHR